MKRFQTLCAALLLTGALGLAGCALLAPLLGLANTPVPVTQTGPDGKPLKGPDGLPVTTYQPLWYAVIALAIRELIPVKTAGTAVHQRLRKPKAA